MQTLLSLHTIGVPLHAPPAHTSPSVHASASLHGSVLGAFTHPVALSQESSVQRLASSHPPLSAVNTQPDAGLQVSTVQAIASSQATGVVMHALPAHASVVHALASLQIVSVSAYEHTPPAPQVPAEA